MIKPDRAFDAAPGPYFQASSNPSRVWDEVNIPLFLPGV
jgi:hypothetical protein